MAYVKHIFNRESPDKIRLQDIKTLIENKTEESLHLDYEEIPGNNITYEGLAKHVSGFLNGSGGIVVFGLSEKEKNKRHIPFQITWTDAKKETVENNLYQKIDPWSEGIQIIPIQNPDKNNQRIFIIAVPKSKDPPHMANHVYYTRLNFQTKPMGHDQVSTTFKQYYLQKYDLVNTVYGPMYNELISHLNQGRIMPWKTTEYDRILRERLFLITQDWEIYESLDSFYERVHKWNEALKVYRFRIADIISNVAEQHFKKPIYESHDHSAVRVEIVAESTHQIFNIDEAILNGKDPVKFWKENYPFDIIRKIERQLEYTEDKTKGTHSTMIIPEKQFQAFIRKLMQEVKKDKLISYIRKEYEDLQSSVAELTSELKDRM